MSISAGFTDAEIREFVYEYQRQPHGGKTAWLAERGVSRHRFHRWRDTVFEGDLELGLVPREGGPMTIPPGKLSAFSRTRAAERDTHEAEVAGLNARIRQLEETNDALGKAIGLLHTMSEHEPEDTPRPTDPSDSSTPRISS